MYVEHSTAVFTKDSYLLMAGFSVPCREIGKEPHENHITTTTTTITTTTAYNNNNNNNQRQHIRWRHTCPLLLAFCLSRMIILPFPSAAGTKKSYSRGLLLKGSATQGVCYSRGLLLKGFATQGVCYSRGLLLKGSVAQGVCYSRGLLLRGSGGLLLKGLAAISICTASAYSYLQV